ncbi:MAG: flagellar basal body rod C-terminal domain-containing protein [Acidimicrobiales bacterium]
MERITITAPSGRELSVGSGSLAGHLSSANETIPDLVADLNAFATKFVDDVNTLHATGFGQDGTDGRDLFSITGGLAESVTVHPDMVDHPEYLAASGTATGTFDGTVAAQLALLGSAADGPAKAYGAFVVKLGAETNRLDFAAQIATESANHARFSLDAAVGVNLDEELTDLMSAQRAYEAAARMVTAVDEMLNTLINSTGLVGR